MLLLCVLTTKSSSYAILTIACFLSYFNNHQQAATHNVVVDKLNSIEESLHEIRNNRNWIRPHSKYRRSNSPKPVVESYEGDILTLWNEFKQLFDAKRKLDNISTVPHQKFANTFEML